MLGVSPNTLRSWERRFGYPSPKRTTGGHRLYELTELEALRQAFEETHNISSAISIARERGEGPASASRLASAFRRFDETRANRLVEESLAVRSVERTVDELLLPAVEGLEDEVSGLPEREMAWRFAAGWLAAAQRVAPPAHRAEGVLIFDATAPGEIEALRVHALELVLRRAGLRTLALGTGLDPARIGHALRALLPDALVLAGRHAQLEALGRIVYATRAVGRPVAIVDFLGALPDTGASTVRRLPEGIVAARDALLERLEARADEAERSPQPARRFVRQAH
jgi:MerR family transcriptional regulator, light-induced transcriptional regulator